MEFEWEDSKEKDNLKKHGTTFTESMSTFLDACGIKLDDPSHSKNEKRLYWVGKSDSGRILTTRFTKRGEKIRIIGCAE